MTWILFLEQSLNGLQFGLMLFLLASGLTLVFGIMDMINLAHGALYMVGAFLAAWLVQLTQSFLLGVLLAVGLTAVVGMLLEATLLRTLYARDHLSQVLATFALILIINESVRMIWGSDLALSAPQALSGPVQLLPGLLYPSYRLVIIAVGLAIALLLMTVSAIAGNLLGYWTGVKVGPKLFNRPDSKVFKTEYVVTTQNFFEKHGSRAIVLARFVPIVRSVITGMAGVARMDYKTYATFSTIGGIVWVCSMTLAGYFLGSIPFIKENIDFVAIGIVLLSLIPVVFEVLRQRRLGKS